MILGLASHPVASCFIEIDEAVRQLRGADDVYFNAHAFDAPPAGVVFNLENVPGQVDPARWDGREVWDFSASNAAKYDATHVPIGYHRSMERFTRATEPDIDIVFTGCLNERRIKVLEALADRDLNVVVIKPGIYGAERDAVLARAKLALNMLFYDDGVFPALRVAHLVANRVPVLSERCREGWGFVPTCDYADLVDAAERRCRSRVNAEDNAAFSYERFRKMPMALPRSSVWHLAADPARTPYCAGAVESGDTVTWDIRRTTCKPCVDGLAVAEAKAEKHREQA